MLREKFHLLPSICRYNPVNLHFMKPISPRRCLSILTTLLSIFFSYANRHTINYGVAEGLSDGCVKSITQDSHGYIWIATDYGLNRYEGDRFRHFEKGNSGLPANELNFIAPDSSDPDILWIATQMGSSSFSLSLFILNQI